MYHVIILTKVRAIRRLWHRGFPQGRDMVLRRQRAGLRGEGRGRRAVGPQEGGDCQRV